MAYRGEHGRNDQHPVRRCQRDAHAANPIAEATPLGHDNSEPEQEKTCEIDAASPPGRHDPVLD
jgi:hypothetical protein